MRPFAHPLITALFVAACVLPVASADEVKRVAVQDGHLAYVERGAGPPLILVHGGLQDYRFWSDVLSALSGHYRVIAYSRRNHYPNAISDDGAPDGAADIHSKDLAEIVRVLKLGPVHIVAHSSGAVAALHFAVDRGGLVRSMVLNEPPAASLLAKTPGGPALLKEQAARLADAREAFVAGDLPRAVRLFVDGVAGPGAFDKRSQLGKQMAADNAVSHRADSTSKRPRPTLTCDDVRRISAPVLLTSGANSSSFFRAIVDELTRCLPRAERVVIADAAHTVLEDQPGQFTDAVRQFLRKQSINH